MYGRAYTRLFYAWARRKEDGGGSRPGGRWGGPGPRPRVADPRAAPGARPPDRLCAAAWRAADESSRLLTAGKIQRSRVDAVTQAGGVRAILEHMAEMGAAARTVDFGARHAMGLIHMRVHPLGRHGQPEARPARAGVVLGIRAEQLLAAAHAGIDTRLLVIGVRAAEGRLRALLLRHLVLQVGQPGAQLGIIGRFGTQSALLAVSRPDMLDGLLARLDQTHQQLVEAARELGTVGDLTLVGQARLIV